jgi:hypothetical protein
MQAGASVAPPNVVTATFYDAARNWVEQPALAVTNAAYVTADGAEEILELDLQGSTDQRQANYLMGRVQEASGDHASALTSYLKASALFPFDHNAASDAQKRADVLRAEHAGLIAP